jgi:predicted AlkP superfamily pyrophosphatase or phosphodiesterase
MSRLAVINVVGLTEALIGEHTPRIAEFRKRGALAHIAPAFPAVTCTAQSNYLTGKTPSEHGIVGNGWFNRELAEVQFWKQSNHLVQSLKLWDALREQSEIVNRKSSIVNLFWWFNMYSSVDFSIPPMAENCSMFTHGHIPSAKKSKKIWANFLSSVFGGRRRELVHRKALPMPPRAGLRNRRSGLKINIRRH